MPKLAYQRNWFSDGGICANLPLQFFDSALPRRPTFAINLAPFPHGQKKSSDEADNSYLPTHNDAGLARRQTVLKESGVGALKQFGSTIIDTARTWVDEGQQFVPGYRDRIVTVFHDGQEGGMNLNMQQEVVTGLSERGRGAADRLVEVFAGDQPGVVPAWGWDNHRWLRFRTAMAAFSDTLRLVPRWVRDRACRDHAVPRLGGRRGGRTAAVVPDRGHAAAGGQRAHPGTARHRRRVAAGPGGRVHQGGTRAPADDAAGAVGPRRGDRSAHVSATTSPAARWPARTAPSM